MIDFVWFQFQYTPQHLVRLLQIIVDNNRDIAVRQIASIHFKNFTAKNWAPHDPSIQNFNHFFFLIFFSDIYVYIHEHERIYIFYF